MAELTVAMVYGQALFEAAEDLGNASIFLEEATELIRLFSTEEDLIRILCTPVIPAQERKRMVKAVFEGRVHQEILNLLFVLIDKSRGNALKAILKQYEHLVAESERCVEGRLISASLLTEEELAQFEMKTGKLLQKKVSLSNEADPKVLGGVRIFIEGKVLDATVETRLKELNDRLMSAVV